MKRRTKSIQSSIFSLSAGIILLLTSASILLYYYTMSRGIVNNYTNSSHQLTKIISSRIDTKVRTIDLLQRRLLESLLLRKYVFETLPQSQERDIFLEQRAFENTVFQIAGYDFPFRHLSILTLDGHLVSFGERYGFSNKKLTSEDIVKITPILEKNGSMILKSLSEEKTENHLPSVSLCRAFSLHPLNAPKAIIEIQIDTLDLESVVRESVMSYDNLSNQIIVIDGNNNLIYPEQLSQENIDYYASIVSDKKNKNPISKQEEITTRYTSSYTEWTTFVVTPYSSVALDTQNYLLLALGFGALTLIVLLFITHAIAKSISSPIIKIKESLEELNWENLGRSSPNIASEYNELELLTDTFTLMEKRLEESLAEHIEIKALSTQSQIMALQSQINPHFMYNTLSVMSILAEENDDYQVAEMGHRLVDMLRYSSKEALQTTIGQEIDHAKNYAQLMNVRFGKKMQFDFLVDPLLLEVVVPSMVIQPLIENCIKYAGSGKNGRLIIATIGEVYGNSWVMQISDNGKGFSHEAITQFHQAISSTESTGSILDQEKVGIGLANIYRRLSLYYGGKSIFKIRNSNYGAIVTIGGLLEGRSL